MEKVSEISHPEIKKVSEISDPQMKKVSEISDPQMKKVLKFQNLFKYVTRMVMKFQKSFENNSNS